MMMHTDVQTPTFDEFFLAEFPRLVSILTAWSGERAVAEDLAQDALLQAHRNWDVVVALERAAMARIRSDGTVKTHLQRARRTLARHLTTDAEAPR